MFRPLSDFVLIEPVDAPNKSKGGIIIPETSQERPAEGNVLATGPGVLDEHGKRSPMSVEKGQRVLFTKYGSTEIKIDGSTFLLVRDRDLLGIVE